MPASAPFEKCTEERSGLLTSRKAIGVAAVTWLLLAEATSLVAFPLPLGSSGAGLKQPENNAKLSKNETTRACGNHALRSFVWSLFRIRIGINSWAHSVAPDKNEPEALAEFFRVAVIG